ncbi:DUF4342 domain-containing protein [Clostridium sp.]|jgi:hypothetical protein|uniref:DUF4342 domain-containing protein n=1 Tax=Clostridium sp. TaxID=1506 RepID=UPI003A5C1A95
MSEITLEKIDIIRDRTGVSYAEAKEALEACNANVVDALIYIEKTNDFNRNDTYTTKDEFIKWLKDTVKKGNVNRIKIKKDDKTVVDIPVNAGIVATLTALVWPPLIAIGILTAVFTKVTIEVTRDDGSVEVVNKIIKNVSDDTVNDVKDKIFNTVSSVRNKFTKKENSDNTENIYKYTVNFDDINEDVADNENSSDKKDTGDKNN